MTKPMGEVDVRLIKDVYLLCLGDCSLTRAQEMLNWDLELQFPLLMTLFVAPTRT